VAALGSAWGLAAETPGEALRVESVTAAPLAGTSALLVEVQLRNVSSAIVTAYAVTVTAQYASGERKSGYTLDDMAASLVFERVSGYGENMRFHPGDLHRARVSLARYSHSAEPVSLEAAVHLVVFADGTAIGPESNVEMLAQNRQREAEESRAFLGDLEFAGQAPIPYRALQERAEELSSKTPENGPGRARLADLKMYARFLEGRPAELTTIQHIFQERVAVLTEQAKLKMRPQ
jgi:hypothetical protein